METVAITLDKKTLAALDSVGGDITRRSGRPNRSLMVRTAIQEYVERRLRLETEEHERAILAKYRIRLAKEAKGLIDAQAKA